MHCLRLLYFQGGQPESTVKCQISSGHLVRLHHNNANCLPCRHQLRSVQIMNLDFEQKMVLALECRMHLQKSFNSYGELFTDIGAD